MPNNYLSVLNKHIIQVENKNGRGGGWGTKKPLPPNQKGVGGGGEGHMPPCPASYASDIYIYIHFRIAIHN